MVTRKRDCCGGERVGCNSSGEERLTRTAGVGRARRMTAGREHSLGGSTPGKGNVSRCKGPETGICPWLEDQ